MRKVEIGYFSSQRLNVFIGEGGGMFGFVEEKC